MIALRIAVVCVLIFVSGDCEGKDLDVYAFLEVDWKTARDYCKNKGKNLVTTLDLKAHNQMGTAIHECSKKCGGKHLTNSWTDAIRSQAPGADVKDFVWADLDKPVVFASWQPKQPDNHKGEEDCVQVWSPDNPKYKRVMLNNRPCSDKFHVICESKTP